MALLFGDHLLMSYQKRRLFSFLNPSYDPLGSGYHLLQSQIAIGSGGLFGKGFLQGTQNQLMFLPVKHTDFIFSILAEEWGFIGCAVVLILFLGLFLERHDNCRKSTRQLWDIIGLRLYRFNLLACNYQCGNGNGSVTGGRSSTQFLKLRRVRTTLIIFGRVNSFQCGDEAFRLLIKFDSTTMRLSGATISL